MKGRKETRSNKEKIRYSKNQQDKKRKKTRQVKVFCWCIYIYMSIIFSLDFLFAHHTWSTEGPLARLLEEAAVEEDLVPLSLPSWS